MPRPPDINELKEKYKGCIKRANMFGALKMLEEIAQWSLAANDDVPVTDIAHNCFLYLSPDLKYENLINQHTARRISDLTLFYLNDEIRKRTFLQSFATGRTLLTPHRRRQLAKTMNAEPRVFAFGLNSSNCLGVDTENCAYVDIPTELNLPPVYEMKMSSRHTVFWCHDGRFFGCGDTSNYMIMVPNRTQTMVFRHPEPLDLQIRKGEYTTGFKALENGTLFETNRRWYFVGDYPKSRAYLKTLHDDEFELVAEFQASENFWICHTRPLVSCSVQKLDDAKNVVAIRILSTAYLVKVYPGYWTELNPGHVKQRPVLYLLDGVETRDIRIENAASGTIWITHQGILYHGSLTMMFKEDNDGNEANLDNYIMFIELHEYRTPTPFVCTGVAANSSDSILIKCGEFPCVSFDYLEMAENRYRGNVHKYMFEAVEKYIVEDYSANAEYSCSKKDSEMKISMEYLLSEADAALMSGQMEEELKMDWLGRIQKKYRYANYYSFLGYISIPRLPNRPPKCFDTDMDCLIDTQNTELIAQNRIRHLFEEFERINYPGTDIWKPTEFLKSHADPEDDVMTEGQYRAAAMKWAMKEFIRQITLYQGQEYYNPDDVVTRDIIEYLINIVWFAQDLWFVIGNSVEPLLQNSQVARFLKESENMIPDDQLVYPSMNPGEIFENRLREGYLDIIDLEERQNIQMTFLLEHQDPTLKPTRFTIKTCKTFLASQNPILLEYIDSENVLDLNKMYPNDKKLHRLIVQTHFIGHGLTDLEGCEQYDASAFRKLGYHLCISQKYMRRGVCRSRGYLLPMDGVPPTQMVGMEPTSRSDIPIETSDGSLIYCHRLVRTLYSALPSHESLPATLSSGLMIAALRGLHDRRMLEMLPMDARIDVVEWYEKAKMHEAFIDLLKQCIIDATTRDTSEIRELVRLYPTLTQRFIAQYRPGILLWPRIPLPHPNIEHIKIITDMWPKNEFERHTRVPRKKYLKNGVVEDSLFHQIGSRELRKWYTNNEERMGPRFTKYYEKDFPLGYPYHPFKPTILPALSPSVSSAAPLAPEKRKHVATIAEKTETTKEKEEKVRMLQKELERLSANQSKSQKKGKRK